VQGYHCQRIWDEAEQDLSGFWVHLIASVSVDLLLIYFAYLCTAVDPTDEVVRQERYCKLTEQEFPEYMYEYFCHLCNTHVNGQTKHCGACQRCCANFDHHCVWVNNCIGGKNYAYFFTMIVLLFVHTSLIVAINSYFLYKTNTLPYYECKEGILIASMACNVLATVFVSYLIIYHIWLFFKGKTTYQHIVQQRIRKAERLE
jgi:palmitoyltransferase